jgi:hypothetical protein
VGVEEAERSQTLIWGLGLGFRFKGLDLLRVDR